MAKEPTPPPPGSIKPPGPPAPPPKVQDGCRSCDGLFNLISNLMNKLEIAKTKIFELDYERKSRAKRINKGDQTFLINHQKKIIKNLRVKNTKLSNKVDDLKIKLSVAESKPIKLTEIMLEHCPICQFNHHIIECNQQRYFVKSVICRKFGIYLGKR
jgi:hypothetical protein